MIVKTPAGMPRDDELYMVRPMPESEVWIMRLIWHMG